MEIMKFLGEMCAMLFAGFLWALDIFLMIMEGIISFFLSLFGE